MSKMTEQPRFEGAQLIVETHGETECYDARFLISTLLVTVAKGDGGISNEESQKMIELLSSKMNIRSAEALEHLSTAIMTLSNEEDIAERLQGISRDLSAEEKDDVLKMMLEVMNVDEHLDPGEKEAILLAGQILGLPQDAVYTQLRLFSPDR